MKTQLIIGFLLVGSFFLSTGKVTMNQPRIVRMSRIRVIAALLGVASCICSMNMASATDDLLEHGRYVFYAAGCISCHTVDQPLAGGRAIDSPFGTFFHLKPAVKY